MRRLYFVAILTFGTALGVSLFTSGGPVTAQASRTSAAATPYLKGGARGIVKTAQGQVVDGLMVQLISEQTSIRTTVYTDEAGRYEFPLLEAGEYVLRVPRPLEFRHYTRTGVRIAGATRLDDIVMQRIGNGDLARRTSCRLCRSSCRNSRGPSGYRTSMAPSRRRLPCSRHAASVATAWTTRFG
jgi:hypothetical protein